MKTPVADFLNKYCSPDTHNIRFHMPGHKGRCPADLEFQTDSGKKTVSLGEKYDITEISGADSLYEADGIIAESERNASELFGTAATFYSTEGSSQCIRAMLWLAVTTRRENRNGKTPVIVAARNVHKSFVYAAALIGFEIEWLLPAVSGSSSESYSLCACDISADALDQKLSSLPCPPAAVYITSPNYLGGMADIRSLANICHRHGTILAVDNAHGAYLHFLKPRGLHPIDLGADICCDSAHKTLPVLTGGAYLHIGSREKSGSDSAGNACFSDRINKMIDDARNALALFGSTSPSYLTLASLDLCNACLASDGWYFTALPDFVSRLDGLRSHLAAAGYKIYPSDPLRITVCASGGAVFGSGFALADFLRAHGIECEYADADFTVLMLTPLNTEPELCKLEAVLLSAASESSETSEAFEAFEDLRSVSDIVSVSASGSVPDVGSGANSNAIIPDRVLSVREAFFMPHERIPVSEAIGRICGAPAVSCPPAIPIVISGERISAEAIGVFRHYGIDEVEVIKEL